jgi:selenide,water dikinase
LRGLKQLNDPNLLVGKDTADDAGVYRIGLRAALVQTVDFFTPIVDDPYTYGAIAATNSLSDVYAMGGRPITAMNLMGMPTDLVPPKMINAILRGGADKTAEAGCVLVGGHTIKNPEPFYGLSVTGFVSPTKVITNANARPGDFLVLTKPLGTGIASTAIKRNICPKPLEKAAIRSMQTLNVAGAALAEAGLVKGGTDVTGFGLLGHLVSMCKASQVTAEIWPEELPVLHPSVLELISQDCIPGGSRENLHSHEGLVDWGKTSEARRFLIADAQTSGGLLLCVAPRNLDKVLGRLTDLGTLCATMVGRIGTRRPGRKLIFCSEKAGKVSK